jgi:hypothetical protein
MAEPITGVRAFQRAKRELDFVDAQIVSLQAKRDATMAGFDHAESLLREQRGAIADSLQVWKNKEALVAKGSEA